MKRWMFTMGVFICAVLAFWAYLNSGKTRMALTRLHQIESQISQEQEHIEILRAEWAILNRPERLRFLVAQNQSHLQLREISTDVYGVSTQVPYIEVPSASDDFIDPGSIEAILQDLINSGEIAAQ